MCNNCIHLKPSTTGVPCKVTIWQDTLEVDLEINTPDFEPILDAGMQWYANNLDLLEAWQRFEIWDEELISQLQIRLASNV